MSGVAHDEFPQPSASSADHDGRDAFLPPRRVRPSQRRSATTTGGLGIGAVPDVSPRRLSLAETTRQSGG